MKRRELLKRIEALEAHCAALEIRIRRLEEYAAKPVTIPYAGPYLDLRSPQLKVMSKAVRP